jgi:DNA-directed RNA polymerase subunit F
MPTKKEKNKLITIPEVKELLEKIGEEAVDQIQRRTLDYVSKFSKSSKEEAKSIRQKLVKEAKLTDKEAVEITNIMPTSKEELRVFTSGWKKLLSDDVLNVIMKILAEPSN